MARTRAPHRRAAGARPSGRTRRGRSAPRWLPIGVVAEVAASRFFGDEPLRLGIIGSGTLARDGLRALASVCRIESARVYSRSSANREAFAAELGPELGVELRPAESAASATAAADMVLCATQTGGEVALTASEAGPALYISSVSSTLPMQRELDGPVIASAGIVVIDTPDTLRESGDLLAAVESGLDPNRAVLLSDFLSDPAADARPPVVYKSIGSVEQDLALATAVFAEAQRRGVGDRVDPVEVPRL